MTHDSSFVLLNQGLETTPKTIIYAQINYYKNDSIKTKQFRISGNNQSRLKCLSDCTKVKLSRAKVNAVIRLSIYGCFYAGGRGLVKNFAFHGEKSFARPESLVFG